MYCMPFDLPQTVSEDSPRRRPLSLPESCLLRLDRNCLDARPPSGLRHSPDPRLECTRPPETPHEVDSQHARGNTTSQSALTSMGPQGLPVLQPRPSPPPCWRGSSFPFAPAKGRPQIRAQPRAEITTLLHVHRQQPGRGGRGAGTAEAIAGHIDERERVVDRGIEPKREDPHVGGERGDAERRRQIWPLPCRHEPRPATADGCSPGVCAFAPALRNAYACNGTRMIPGAQRRGASVVIAWSKLPATRARGRRHHRPHPTQRRAG